LETLDAWFARGKARFPGVIPCAAGCADCCLGPFDISVADLAQVVEGVAKLPLETRRQALGRARASLERTRALAPEWEPPYAVESLGEDRFDAVCEALHDEPCPLLDAKSGCTIYADRPLVCRLMGLSMKAGPTRTIDNACPIQGRFPGYPALPPVEFDLAAFEEEERACLTEASATLFGDARYAEFHTWIAGGLVTLSDALLREAPARGSAAPDDQLG